MQAFCAILAKKPKKGKWWTLGIAEEDKPGYYPVKESGDAEDPLYLSKFETRFDTQEDAKTMAQILNWDYFMLTKKEAFEIVLSSMRAQNLLEDEQSALENQNTSDEQIPDENINNNEQLGTENNSTMMNPKQKLLNRKEL